MSAADEKRAGLAWVDNARILGMLAVVVLHVAANVVARVEDRTSAQWWAGHLFDSALRWCVPVFVMLSGALLLRDDREETLGAFFGKRVARVAAPLLFWSAFFLAWTFAKGFAKGAPPTFSALGRNLLAGKPYYHMWFLYMLVGLYAVTPLLRILVRHTPVRTLGFFVAGLFALAAVNSLFGNRYDKSGPLFINLFPLYLPYFLLGHLLAVSPRVFPWRGPVAALALAAALTAAGYYLIAEAWGLKRGRYFYDYNSVTVIPMSIAAMLLLQRLKKPLFFGAETTNGLAGLVLGIYLVHPVVFEGLRFVGADALASCAALSVPLLGLAVFALSAALAWAIRGIPCLGRVV